MKKTPEKFWDDYFAEPIQQDEQASPQMTFLRTEMSNSHVADKSTIQDIECTIECSLKEFYNGSIRTIEFERHEVDHNPKVSHCYKRQKQVEVKPGFSEKTVLVFKGEGNQAYEQCTTNLVIRFRQARDERCERVGNDLILTKDVTFEDVLK